MGGIAGIVGRVDGGNRSALDRMGAALAHRGPEGWASWASRADGAGWGVLLGHRRLHAHRTAQPLVADGGALVFDGRILNHRDLGAANGACDASALFHALGGEGASALPRLRGPFALAFWDAGARRLVVARDPLGVKPLYVARNPDPDGTWSVAFASELRALLRSGLLGTPRLDPDAVRSVVWNGFVVGPTTAVRGVELLPAGRWVGWPATPRPAAEEVDFWSPAPGDAPPSDEEDLAAALERAVALQLDEGDEAPLAIFLSSGVDSSVVAHLAQRASSEPVQTFTLAFEERELNEGPRAAAIAQAIGARHREVVLSEERFVSGLEDALDRLDQPTFDGLNAYFMSRSVREAGFSVAMVGSGGDELFGGYPTFRALPTLHHWTRRMRWIPKELRELAGRAGTFHLRGSNTSIPPQTRWSKLPELLGSGGDLKALYQLAYALFLPAFQRELLAPELAEPLPFGLPEATHRRLEAELAGCTPLAAVSVLEQRLFLGERLLRDNDGASLAASVEQRSPLVDVEVFDVVRRLPEAQRFEPLGRKDMLRRVGLRGLDPSLFERPKAGFVLPYDRWIRRGLRKPMDRVLRDPEVAAAAGLAPETVERLWRSFLDGAPGVYWSRVWAVYVLLRWSATHGVRI